MSTQQHYIDVKHIETLFKAFKSWITLFLSSVIETIVSSRSIIICHIFQLSAQSNCMHMPKPEWCLDKAISFHGCSPASGILARLTSPKDIYINFCCCFLSPSRNFEEVEGAYWFGPVCLWVAASVTLCIPSRTVRDRILKFNIWNKRAKKADPYFFSFPSDLSLFRLSFAL